MKLLLLSKSDLLAKELKKQELFTEIEKDGSTLTTFKDVVIVSENFLSRNDILETDLSATRTIYITDPSITKGRKLNFNSLCRARDILVIEGDDPLDKIIETVKNAISPFLKNDKKIMTFFSPNPNIGTSSVAYSVAESLAKQAVDSKIGFLSINPWSTGDDQLNYEGYYLDEIKEKLSFQSLNSPEERIQMYHRKKDSNLFILAGNRDHTKERQFTLNEIEYLLDIAEKDFDVVIVDAGAHIDNAVIIKSIEKSKRHFIVANQQEKTKVKFDSMYESVLYRLGYSKDDFLLILNQIKSEPFLKSAKEISKEYGIDLLSEIPEVQSGFASEVQKHSLYSYGDAAYNSKIEQLSSFLVQELDLKVESLNEKRPSFIKRIFN